MIWLISYLAIFVFIGTYFSSFALNILCFVFLGFLFSFIYVFHRKFPLHKQIIYISIGFVLCILSIFVYNIRYFSLGEVDVHHGIIGTGQVVEQLDSDRYYVQLSDFNFILHTNKDLQITQNLYIIGSVYPAISSCEFCSKYISLPQNDFDYDRWLFMKNIHGSIYDEGSIVLGKDEDPGLILSLRHRLTIKVKDVYGQDRNAGLVLGMLIGDRALIPSTDYTGFIDSGLVHIIAVSGGNLVILIVFLSAILFFVPFYPRLGIVLVIISIYALVCGMDSSIFRAWIMGVLGILALFFGRGVDVWRAMGYAFIVMLLFNPYFLIYDMGFLLSFGALSGIILLTDIFKDSKNRFINFPVIKWYLLPTVGASLGVIPVLAFFVDSFNIIGIVANLLVLPIVPFVMVYGFIVIFLASIIDLSGFIYLQDILLAYIYKVSFWTNMYGIYMPINNILIRILFICIIIGFIISLRTRRKIQS